MSKEYISTQVKTDSAVLLFFIVLIRLPQLLSPFLELFVSTSLAIFLLAYTFLNAYKHKFKLKRLSKLKVYLVLLFLSLEILSFIRAAISGVIDLGEMFKFSGIAITVVFYLLFSLNNVKSLNDLKYLMRGIVYGFSILIIINYMLYIFGIEPYQSGSEYLYGSSYGVLLSSIGYMTPSAIYPLEAGPKLLGGVLVFISLTSLILFLNKKNTLYFLIIFLLCFWMILLSDARLYAAILVLFILMTRFYKKITSKLFLKMYLIIFPILPILLIVVASYVSELPGIDILSRSEDDNISSLSSRTLIWNQVGYNILQINPELFYGYGAAGTVNSGINNEVAYLFDGGWANTGIKTAHNIILQQLLDKGIIGVIVFLFIIRSLIYTFRTNKSAESNAFLFGTLALMLAGSLNTIFYYASTEIYILFLILLGLHTSIYFEKSHL